MTSFILIFGKTPRLSEVEFRSVYPSEILTKLSDRVSLVQTNLEPKDIMKRCGGIVKIARCLATGGERIDIDSIIDAIHTSHHIEFGLSWYGESESISGTSKLLKSELIRRGISSRYVIPKNDQELSSVVSEGVKEIIIVSKDSMITTGIVVATQDYQMWQKVDYGRPVSDAKRGMLPPKVARMAINIALGPLTSGKTILDPFCGVGTIPTEAMFVGVSRVISSDADPKAIEATQKNLQWVTSTFPDLEKIKTDVFTQDATHISTSLAPGSVDAIVTEPFMGDPKVAYTDRPDLRTEERVKNTLKGLTKLYIGCLREWKTILTPGVRIVIAFPQYAINGKIFGVKNVVDMCEKYGYTVEDGPIEYGRTGAIVRRAFYVITVS